jgi:hypothetical protein
MHEAIQLQAAVLRMVDAGAEESSHLELGKALV